MPNGNVLMIVWDKKTADECIAAGRKKELVSKYLLPDSVVEVKPTGKTLGRDRLGVAPLGPPDPGPRLDQGELTASWPTTRSWWT